MAKLDYSKIFIKEACPTSIGGQAVMEGIMMQGPDRLALAMRLPGGLYLRTKKKAPSPSVMKVPFARGIVAFARSFVNGMSTLMESADILEKYAPEEYDEEPGKIETWVNDKFGSRAAWNFMMISAVVFALVVSVLFFIILPTWVVNFLGKWVSNVVVLNLVEGLLRIAMFIGYVVAIRRLEDIKTLFRYHGAEHKTIHCYENNLELTPDNADMFYTLHPRCGTSFMVFVLIVSLLLFSFLGWPNLVWRITSRILLIPVIAGISYELLRLAGRSDGRIVRILSYPGLMLQRLTTMDPTKEQLEVGILSLKAVLVDPETEEIDGIVDKDGNPIDIPDDVQTGAAADSKDSVDVTEEKPEAAESDKKDDPNLVPTFAYDNLIPEEYLESRDEAERALKEAEAKAADLSEDLSNAEDISSAVSAEDEVNEAAEAAAAEIEEMFGDDSDDSYIDIKDLFPEESEDVIENTSENAESAGSGEPSGVFGKSDQPDIVPGLEEAASDIDYTDVIDIKGINTMMNQSEAAKQAAEELSRQIEEWEDKTESDQSDNEPVEIEEDNKIAGLDLETIGEKAKGILTSIKGLFKKSEEPAEDNDMDMWGEGSEVMRRKMPVEADEPGTEEGINAAIDFLNELDKEHGGYTVTMIDGDDEQSLAAGIAEHDANEAKQRTLKRRYTNDIMTIENALKWGQATLSMVENGRNEATTIMSYATGLTRTELITRGRELMRNEDFKEYEKRIQARLTGTPLQYILGMQEFMGLPFRVNPSVLIPRLDTEVLTEKVIDILKESDVPHPDVLDLCTGSGAIGISIASKVPNAYVTMSDASENALHTAMSNAGLNGVNRRCIFLIGDMFDALPEYKVFDLIVCNPPYIRSSEIETLSTEVKDHEPRMALDGGDDGLDYYRIIADHAGSHLRSGGILALEIGSDQAGNVKRLLMKSGSFNNIRKYKDLAGLDRVIIAERI